MTPLSWSTRMSWCACIAQRANYTRRESRTTKIQRGWWQGVIKRDLTIIIFEIEASTRRKLESIANESRRELNASFLEIIDEKGLKNGMPFVTCCQLKGERSSQAAGQLTALHKWWCQVQRVAWSWWGAYSDLWLNPNSAVRRTRQLTLRYVYQIDDGLVSISNTWCTLEGGWNLRCKDAACWQSK